MTLIKSKKAVCFAAGAVLAALAAGCASSERMMRMSGGVFDEYSVPKSSRIRSEKYQRVTRKLDSDSRANRDNISGLDGTLVNLWPFYFRSSDYWSVLWPMIDCDPYGFAFRPFYNHEGDEYSILFPLSAWSASARNGWAGLFVWKHDGCGLVPFTWQSRGANCGSGYYTPLCIWSYDDNPLHYTTDQAGHVTSRWLVKDLSLFLFPVLWGHETCVRPGKEWEWLFSRNCPEIKNEWIYRFNGKKPFPASEAEFEKFRAEVFATLPRIEKRSRGIIPLWWGNMSDDGSYYHRFLLLSGCEWKQEENDFQWDILWGLLARYRAESNTAPRYTATAEKNRFVSLALMSYFSAERQRHRDPMWRKFRKLSDLAYRPEPFNQRLPKIKEALKDIDPALKLPETVVDDKTLNLFIDEWFSKYRFAEDTEYFGTCVPLFWYKSTPEYSRWILPALLTWWRSGKPDRESYFRSLPLMTFITHQPFEDKSIIMTPLGYYAKTIRADRRNRMIFSRRDETVPEYACVEIRDRYALCGLFYRGRFGFNAAKPGVDAGKADKLRAELSRLPAVRKELEDRKLGLDRETAVNDRWQTKGEIERLKKLIRIEEIKIAREKLAEDRKKYDKNVSSALAVASALKFDITAETFTDKDKAQAAAGRLLEQYTDLCYYEDIGYDLLFHKMKFANGDSRWKLLHILAGGEKTGERESTHILHLLYRYRREGARSETVCFPFIVSRKDGEDSSFSFMWRVFERKKRNGRISGHIFFIPFGEE